MKRISRKKHLEIKLQSIPPHPKPKVELEQYTTPAFIASDVVWNAYSFGDIENRDVVDLGCGTGIFTIASSLMGAKSAVGVDIDGESINLGCEIRDKFKLNNIKFFTKDISQFNEVMNVDTIIQNPPFGSQRKSSGGEDLKFINKAVELGFKVLYSFHMASTETFLLKFYKDNNLEITHIFRYKFPISKIYDFHKKEKLNVDIIVIRAIME